MKRQAAVIGPTPEFVRWSVRHSCPIRQETDLASIDQTEKRLRTIRVAGAALATGQTREGLALRSDSGNELQGFRLSDIFDVWGGQENVTKWCADCPANIVQVPEVNGSIAGCCGWLGGEVESSTWHAVFDNTWPGRAACQLLETKPRWYGLWASGSWRNDELSLATDWFGRVAQVESPVQSAAIRFHQVLAICVSRNLTIDVELVPAGNSNGLHWTWVRHCDRCRAPALNRSMACPVCGKAGRGHPEIRHRVLGHRPWVDLATIVDPEQLSRLAEWHRQH